MLDHVLPLFERPEAWNYINRIVSGNATETEDITHSDGDKATRQALEPWNEAFEAALREYAVFMSEKDQSQAPVAYKTYLSIEEASLFLKKILDKL